MFRMALPAVLPCFSSIRHMQPKYHSTPSLRHHHQTHASMVPKMPCEETANAGTALCVCIQLNCPSVKHWAYASIFAVDVRFQDSDELWISHSKLHGACFLIFCKSSKRARLASFRLLKSCFSAGFRDSIGLLSSKSIYY